MAPTRRFLAVVLLPLLALAGCEQDPTGTGGRVASVVVTPSVVPLREGATTLLAATPRDGGGRPLSGLAVAWSTSDSTVARVDAAGNVRAVGPGTATVTARVEETEGRAEVSVAAVPVASVEIDTTALLVPLRGTRQLRATVRDSAGNVLARRVTWTTSRPGTLGIDSAGVASGLRPGAAAVSASAGGRSATASASVELLFRSVSAGQFHTCGISLDGRAWCWGTNAAGQLGIPPDADQFTNVQQPTPYPVALPGGRTFTALDASMGGSYLRFTDLLPTPAPVAGHTCGTLTSGETYCWGAGTFNELSGTGRSFAVVKAGRSHSCALDAGGQAWCWGASGLFSLENLFPPVPTGACRAKILSYTCSSTPVRARGSVAFDSLSAGYGSACALTRGGAAYCWNWLGNDSIHASTNPAPVTGIPPLRSISVGYSACGLTAEGAAYCWGSGGSPEVPGGLRFTRVTAGGWNCGLTAEGRAYCWSWFSVPAAPTPAAGELRFTSLDAGASHVCGVTREGRAYCWGANTYGQLGDGTTSDSPAPVRVVAPR